MLRMQMLINLVATHDMILLLSSHVFENSNFLWLVFTNDNIPCALEVFAQISTRKQSPQMSDAICQYKAVLLFSPCLKTPYNKIFP